MTSDAQATHLQCSILQHMTSVGGTIQATTSPRVMKLRAATEQSGSESVAQPCIVSRELQYRMQEQEQEQEQEQLRTCERAGRPAGGHSRGEV